MEKERIRSNTPEPLPFEKIVRKAKDGDKKSMELVLDLFIDDIEYLSRFIMLPKEEAVQVLKIELLGIVCEQL